MLFCRKPKDRLRTWGLATVSAVPSAKDFLALLQCLIIKTKPTLSNQHPQLRDGLLVSDKNIWSGLTQFYFFSLPLSKTVVMAQHWKQLLLKGHGEEL